jgi:hypothetical protein
MATTDSLALDHDPCSIIGTRVLDALRDLVFSVWTDPSAAGSFTYREIAPDQKLHQPVVLKPA